MPKNKKVKFSTKLKFHRYKQPKKQHVPPCKVKGECKIKYTKKLTKKSDLNAKIDYIFKKVKFNVLYITYEKNETVTETSRFYVTTMPRNMKQSDFVEYPFPTMKKVSVFISRFSA